MPATTPEPLSVRLVALRDLFQRQFGAAPTLIARAPGRVNLIGEHTDYNDGYVFPIAIERDTLVAAHPRADRQVRLYSVTLRRASQWSLDAIATSADQPWSNYVRGLTRFLQEDGVTLAGADLAIASTVPLGAGVSSSAALETAAGTALLALAGATREPSALALLCQRVENGFVGVNSGIMDQFISGLAISNHALFLDCRTLQHEQVLLPTDHVIGVADTGVKHGLVASEYNARRAECEQAVRLLQPVLPGIRALRDVGPAQLSAHSALLPVSVARRSRHVVTENARVLAAVAALRSGDLAAMGNLMYASHASLRDDYNVTVPELDTLVEAASGVRGVVGSRMTGGGFGGCTVNLVARSSADAFARYIATAYRAATGLEPAVYRGAGAPGVERVA